MTASLFARVLRANSSFVSAAVLASAIALAPTASWACACGCGIFDVGVMSLPLQTELLTYFRYDYMN